MSPAPLTQILAQIDALKAQVTALAPGDLIAQDEDQLSDTFIADVIDDAFRKGIEMRNVQRIDGPYPHGSRFRLRVVEVGGRRKYLAYPSEEEAKRALRAFERELERRDGPTVNELIGEYEKGVLRAAGNKERGIVSTIGRLRIFFEPMLAEKAAQLTAARATHLLEVLATRPSRQGETLAVDTRKNILAEAKTFARWAAAEGHLKPDVLADLKVAGRRKKGKAQLRYGERARWHAEVVRQAQGGDEAALAALVALDGDLRSSEVTKRLVRDVDQGGRVLWVEDAKTPSGNRTVVLGDEVAALLAKLVEGRGTQERLFPALVDIDDPKSWLLRNVKRICKAAGVPEVTPHGLRGTGATNDLLRELVGGVSRRLGHAGTEVTLNHYLDPEVVAQVRQAIVRASLEVPKRSQGGPTGAETISCEGS